ncbi:unnamed protein product [Allacma fusca]|uniref:Uncharacterized protein n=2 Tax=Allacma fusca TaxID=39272 RepID=A0A8J2PAI2_9HEXA|nr:unnamed protein product [Allacma fusca]
MTPRRVIQGKETGSEDTFWRSSDSSMILCAGPGMAATLSHYFQMSSKYHSVLDGTRTSSNTFLGQSDTPLFFPYCDNSPAIQNYLQPY